MGCLGEENLTRGARDLRVRCPCLQERDVTAFRLAYERRLDVFIRDEEKEGALQRAVVVYAVLASNLQHRSRERRLGMVEIAYPDRASLVA